MTTYYEKNKDKIKQYYLDNRERIIQRNVNYYFNNKEKVQEYWKTK